MLIEETQLFEIKIMVISERKKFIRIPKVLSDEWDYKIAFEALKQDEVSIHDFEIVSEYFNENSLEISPLSHQDEQCRVIIPECDLSLIHI